MAFAPEAIDRLKSQLLTSGLSQQNQALFQVINQLIDAARDSLTGVQSLTNLTISSGGIVNATYLTELNETGSLPNSRRLLAGKAVTFNDLIPGERTVNADLPVNSIFSTAINLNPSILLGYGTWVLFATGVGASGNPMIITVQ